MARDDPARTNESSPPADTSPTDGRPPDGGSRDDPVDAAIDRRSYLKMAGVTAAALGATATTGSVAGDAGAVEVIEIGIGMVVGGAVTSLVYAMAVSDPRDTQSSGSELEDAE